MSASLYRHMCIRTTGRASDSLAQHTYYRTKTNIMEARVFEYHLPMWRLVMLPGAKHSTSIAPTGNWGYSASCVRCLWSCLIEACNVFHNGYLRIDGIGKFKALPYSETCPIQMTLNLWNKRVFNAFSPLDWCYLLALSAFYYFGKNVWMREIWAASCIQFEKLKWNSLNQGARLC